METIIPYHVQEMILTTAASGMSEGHYIEPIGDGNFVIFFQKDDDQPVQIGTILTLNHGWYLKTKRGAQLYRKDIPVDP